MNEDLQKRINKIMHEHNYRGVPDFEGYSPVEMEFILHDTFGDNSPIKLQRLAEADYKKIPLLNQINYLIGLINEAGELKLTNKGFLPVKIVTDIYNQGFIKDECIESGISKLYREMDSVPVNLTHILLKLSGLSKKRHNKLSLTKSGKTIIDNNFELLRLIFTTFCLKFNWAYYDRYWNEIIGLLGFGFSLILLSKYGNEKRLDGFYADRYFKAFPQLIDDTIVPYYGTKEYYAERCYSLRTFERFLDFFGLIKIESGKEWNSDKYITKTDLFDKFIKCEPPVNWYDH